MAQLQIPAAPINTSAGGTGFRNLFHVLLGVRDRAWPLFVGAVPADVPMRFPLLLRFFI